MGERASAPRECSLSALALAGPLRQVFFESRGLINRYLSLRPSKKFLLRPKDRPSKPVLIYDMRMIVSDEDLALAAAGGDADAYQLLLTRVYDRLFGLCFRLTGARAEAEDLTQDICLALPGKLSGYRAQAKVTTWLYRVAVNAATDRRRRATTYSRATSGWGDWELDRQASVTEKADATAWLYGAIAGLNPALRDTLALVLDDVTHAEAADILGVTEGTISWRVSEAKTRLRIAKEREEAS